MEPELLVQTLKDLVQFCDPKDDIESIQDIVQLRQELSEGLAAKDAEQQKYIDELTEDVHEAEESAKKFEAPLISGQEMISGLSREIEVARNGIDGLNRQRVKLRQEVDHVDQVVASIRANIQRIEPPSGTETMAKVKHQLSFYAMLSNVKWDYSSDSIKGVISTPQSTKDFEIEGPVDFSTVNDLWAMISE